ncbi:hypothetical protein BN7_1524 [Wickerhamomyces ciferrii]|uniref:Endonuclease/exonuclease/phosphatase domain-containing protein n=1 Tax=Wickerhamomyces ciferrii (strain ATCC 14091 / BCRC 22168 / CBS 111 / JCM 3599 / NBRC 0793 / NRRL Y-1031 F-60-10) TaxID=1206466 RepID=K0KAI0_WICCF|nr:uncharacterized protein BN7_1524 [Wickerhamomyces ciferrii]CCH41985.1 hypothetical protein BN7_1524 [Wickerhamomyces ciferrii]
MVNERSPLMNSNSFNKNIKFLLITALVLLVTRQLFFMSEPAGKEVNFKIYNQNIRYDNKNADGKGEKPWNIRKVEIAKSIQYNSFNTKTIITLQEVLKNQLDDLLKLLNEGTEKEGLEPKWTYYGVGRSDCKTNGEYSPIIYNKEDFKLLDSSTFWLSETPNVPGSIGWDANQERIVTWAHLKPQWGEAINIFNTHLDHLGKKSREESVKLIANKTRSYNEDISFITGDFNSEPNEEAYQTLQKIFKDSRLHNDVKYGFDNTFTGFDSKSRHKVIDYVFIDPRLDSVKGFGVLDNHFDGIYSSDHRPVVVEITV